ncbi:acetate/propionate family kinase [Patescibacteria group bacterium]|nr:acetate/propionate family kinase [Patescibacteria group bacterium]
MNKYILTLNAGSATLKVAIFSNDLQPILTAQVEKIGQAGSFLQIISKGNDISIKKRMSNHTAAFKTLFKLLDRDIINNINIVGHRVVHGGIYYSSPVKIDKTVINNIKKLSDLAPLHNPKNLAVIIAAKKLLSNINHFAVFDTAFHQTIPAYAYLYSLPIKVSNQYNIRKYGFHGMSHQYCMQEATKKLKKPANSLNLITVHLGNGASITAIKNGKSVDTSMGFTPLAGLTMGTRVGDIDPGIIFYLLSKGVNYKKLDKIFNNESGIKGLFGSQDLRDVLITAGYKIPGYTKPSSIKGIKKQAQLTLDIFIYDILRYIYTYLGVLKDVDAIVFTGGIGERNADIRKLIIKGSNYKGKTMVIKANEELMMASLIKNKR